jgi:broad specificity phosphatase PhoE
VRHGRTAWNADGRFQGQTDVPLDETGRAQASGLAALLSELPIARAISSDLSRASETARIVIGTRPIALEFDEDWREMKFGAWEGLTWSEIVQRYPEVDRARATVPKFYTPEGGETFDDVCVRVRRAVDHIARSAAPGERVLVATHAGVLHALLRVALGEDEATALGVRFNPGTVTRIAFERDATRIVALNEGPDAAQMSAGRGIAGE